MQREAYKSLFPLKTKSDQLQQQMVMVTCHHIASSQGVRVLVPSVEDQHVGGLTVLTFPVLWRLPAHPTKVF